MRSFSQKEKALQNLYAEENKKGGDKVRVTIDFPPVVHYNPTSGFPGLGKELWHAWQSLMGKAVPGGKVVEWDLWAIPNVLDHLKNGTMPKEE